MREALFSILGSVQDLRVADLFAGSGAVGIEALSRGARSAVFVESDRQAVAAIRANLEAVDAQGAEVFERDAYTWLRTAPAARFDLVFCDPPYDASSSIAQPLSELLPRATAPEARIVIESAKRNPLALDLPLLDERTYGATRIAIYSSE